MLTTVNTRVLVSEIVLSLDIQAVGTTSATFEERVDVLVDGRVDPRSVVDPVLRSLERSQSAGCGGANLLWARTSRPVARRAVTRGPIHNVPDRWPDGHSRRALRARTVFDRSRKPFWP
jgi:hypothetical protein